MTRRVVRYGLAAAAFAAVAWLSTSQPTAQYGGGGGGRAAENAKLAAVPTPKMADGHPDPSGRWGGGRGGGGKRPANRLGQKGDHHKLCHHPEGRPVHP